jgi:hypothetical protein
MLIIRGDTRVADIFLGEFMRLFNHFQVRNMLNKLSDEAEAAPTLPYGCATRRRGGQSTLAGARVRPAR